MAKAAVPGRRDQVGLSAACLERQLAHHFGRLILTPVDKDHRNSKSGFFFPHAASNIALGMFLLPHEDAVRREAVGAQNLLGLLETDRGDVISHDPQALSRRSGLGRVALGQLIGNTSCAVAKIEQINRSGILVRLEGTIHRFVQRLPFRGKHPDGRPAVVLSGSVAPVVDSALREVRVIGHGACAHHGPRCWSPGSVSYLLGDRTVADASSLPVGVR